MSTAPPRRDVPAALAGLRLSAGDLEALARAGFVAAERRDGRPRRYKLRFRQGGRQHVRCIGRDAARAEEVRAALAELQAPDKLARRLARDLAETRRALREAKQLLEPRAAALGLRLHGYSFRRPRPPGAAARTPQ